MIPRRLLAGLPLALAAPRIARSQGAFPNRPIRMLVGSTAGGSQDVTARIVAAGMAERLGQPVVVENRGGANGTLVFEPVLRAAPDGYTICINNMGAILIHPMLEPSVPIAPLRDLAPVGLAADVTTVLVTPMDRPWRTLEELVAAARARPGELSWSHPGTGSSPWLAASLMTQSLGLGTIAVSYRGGAQAVLDVLSGRIDFSFATTPTALPHVAAGKLRALAVPTARRLRQLPDVPTMVERGHRDFLVSGWFALLAPPRTPEGVIERLNAAIDGTTASPAAIEAFEREGMVPLGGSAADFARRAEEDRERWLPIVRIAAGGIER